MNAHKERLESNLLELLQEALSSLNDSELNSLSVTRVECSRGKHHAHVFVLSKDNKILSKLKKAESLIRQFVLQTSGWFKCPKLSFALDNSLEEQLRLDAIFNQIAKGKNDD
ncbi:30S ribosome-binding factor RbfA [Helicobacter cetorum]|uniref:30S ribosome-binding factor RbfA n=1 Tax=Helicobacter cetorum TaxID=138563 RepID=UPI000CF0B557|nr:30S ribosome-binding factor RbfA [Helicobacter cetorum]